MSEGMVAILLPVMLCCIVMTYLLAVNLLDRFGPPRKSVSSKKKKHPHYDDEMLNELLERAERLNQRVANLEEIHRSHREVA
jgi:hypothetical protein